MPRTLAHRAQKWTRFAVEICGNRPEGSASVIPGGPQDREGDPCRYACGWIPFRSATRPSGNDTLLRHGLPGLDPGSGAGLSLSGLPLDVMAGLVPAIPIR
jgi:hypothetical protein